MDTISVKNFPSSRGYGWVRRHLHSAKVWCIQKAGKWWAGLLFQASVYPGVSWNIYWPICSLIIRKLFLPIAILSLFQNTVKKLQSYLKLLSHFHRKFQCDLCHERKEIAVRFFNTVTIVITCLYEQSVFFFIKNLKRLSFKVFIKIVASHFKYNTGY